MKQEVKDALADLQAVIRKHHSEVINWTAHYGPNGPQGFLQIHLTIGNGDGMSTSFAEPVAKKGKA